MFSEIDWLALITWFTLTFGIGNMVSNAMTSGAHANMLRNMGVYPIQPPSIVFTSIWIPLYCASAVAVLRVWQTKGSMDIAVWELSLSFYVVQNVLASFWSSLAFNYRNIKLSMAVILFAFIFSALNLVFFYLQDKVAGALMTPYALWMFCLVYFTMGLALTKKPPPGTEILAARSAVVVAGGTTTTQDAEAALNSARAASGGTSSSTSLLGNGTDSSH